MFYQFTNYYNKKKMNFIVENQVFLRKKKLKMSDYNLKEYIKQHKNDMTRKRSDSSSSTKSTISENDVEKVLTVQACNAETIGELTKMIQELMEKDGELERENNEYKIKLFELEKENKKYQESRLNYIFIIIIIISLVILFINRILAPNEIFLSVQDFYK